MSQVKDIGVATNNGFAKIKEMYYKKDADTFEKLVLPEVERVDANPFIVDVPFPVKENEKFTVGVEATTTKGDISYITYELESVNDNATDGLGLLVPKDYDGNATEDVVYIMQPDNKTTIFSEGGYLTAIDTQGNIGNNTNANIPKMSSTEYGIGMPDGATTIVNDNGDLVAIDNLHNQGNTPAPLMTATEYGIAKPDGTTCIINDAGELVCIDTNTNVDPIRKDADIPDNVIYTNMSLVENMTSQFNTANNTYTKTNGTITVSLKVNASANLPDGQRNIIPYALIMVAVGEVKHCLFNAEGVASILVDSKYTFAGQSFAFYIVNKDGFEKYVTNKVVIPNTTPNNIDYFACPVPFNRVCMMGATTNELYQPLPEVV